MRALLGTDSYFTEDSQYSPNRHVITLFGSLKGIASSQFHLKALIVFQCGKVPRVKVTISVHIAIQGRSNIYNVAQLQPFILLLVSSVRTLRCASSSEFCVDEEEVFPVEIPKLRILRHQLKDDNPYVWFHSADSPNSLVSASVPKHKAAIVETIAAFLRP